MIRTTLSLLVSITLSPSWARAPKLGEPPTSSSVDKVVVYGNEVCELPTKKERLADVKKIFREQVVRLFNVNSDGSKAQVCSGTLIDSNEILTAEHCFTDDSEFSKGLNGKSMEAEIFDTDTRKTRRIKIDRVKGKRTDQVDIAIVSLAEHVAPPRGGFLELASASPICDKDSKVYAGGFGTFAGNSLSNCPSFTEYERSSIQEANFKTMLDAKTTVRDLPAGKICHGDSGGPAICKSKGKYVLLGVIHGIGIDDQQKKDEYEQLLKDRRMDTADFCASMDKLFLTDAQQASKAIPTLRQQAPATAPRLIHPPREVTR